MRKNKKAAFFACVLLIVCAAVLPAQESETDIFGVILYADGNQLSIFRQGELYQYDIFAEDVIGLPLLEGDMVQTEDNSFVEIQLLPSESVIKVAENTTFEITTIGTQGGGSFELLYGRVRAKVSRLNNDDNFSIRGRTALAGVRGTDFGFDYVATRDTFFIPETAVYCFEGSVEVSGGRASNAVAAGDGTTQSQETETGSVLISALEMVDVKETEAQVNQQSFVPSSTRLETRSLSPEIEQYWEENNFKTSAINPEDIDKVFPNLKADLDIARKQADLAARKRAHLESGKSLREFREAEGIVARSNRERYETIEPIGMAGLLRNIEPEIYKVKALTVTGAIMGIAGAAMETTGIIFTYFSEDLGMDPIFREAYGPVLMGAGGVTLSISILSFILE